MGWRKGRYFYKVGLLRYLADNWDNLYIDGVDMGEHTRTNPIEIAEWRADFEFALNKIGRRARTAIKEYIKGTEDYVMEMRGYYEPRKLRNKGYHNMKILLNGGE